MFLLVDSTGIIHGQTSDRRLVMPLKNALEFVLKTKIYVFRRYRLGAYKFYH